MPEYESHADTASDTPTPEAPDQTPTHAAGDAADPLAPIDSAHLTDDDKNLGMLAHLLGAFTGFLGPLVIWLMKKDHSPFVEREGKEALNFHITVLIVYFALIPVSIITCGVGGLLYLPVFVVAVVFSILGALKAKDGIAYRYPFALRLVK